jgi:hypothetical protein
MSGVISVVITQLIQTVSLVVVVSLEATLAMENGLSYSFLSCCQILTLQKPKYYISDMLPGNLAWS